MSNLYIHGQLSNEQWSRVVKALEITSIDEQFTKDIRNNVGESVEKDKMHTILFREEEFTLLLEVIDGLMKHYVKEE